MYTILFNADKELVQTVRVPIFAGERNMTKLRFLIAPEIEETDIQMLKVELRYELPNGMKYATTLLQDPETYRNYLSYTYPVTAEFTQEPGYVYYYLTFVDETGAMLYKSATDIIEIRKRAKEEASDANIVWETEMALFPRPGEVGTLYIDTSNDKIYRWDDIRQEYVIIGSDYMDISEIEDGEADG